MTPPFCREAMASVSASCLCVLHEIVRVMTLSVSSKMDPQPFSHDPRCRGVTCRMAESRRRDRMGFLGSLARGLAHEIKNPLSTLTVNLQMMREDLTEPLTARERRILKRLETLEREVKRSESILNDFVGFAR